MLRPLLAILFVLAFASSCQKADTTAVTPVDLKPIGYEAIGKAITQKLDTSQASITIMERELTELAQLAEYYHSQDNHSLWYTNLGFKKAVHELVELLADSYTDGLAPEDYHAELLFEQYAILNTSFQDEKEVSVDQMADFEILLTDGCLHYAKHQYFGKYTPEEFDPGWHAAGKTDTLDMRLRLNRLSRSAKPTDVLYAFAPQHSEYQGLKFALAHYRELRQELSFPPISSIDSTIKPGHTHPVIIDVRARLVADGLMKNYDVSNLAYYDSSLIPYVIKFQQKNGLATDGEIGARTVEMLSQTIDDYITAIKVNMERWRWLPNDFGEKYMMVNIPGYELYLMEHDSLMWHTKAVVGKTSRKTPVMSDVMTYLQLSPKWTIPPTILGQDVLPQLTENTDYLAKKGYVVYDAKTGQKVNPDSVKWNSYSSKTLPYKIQQPAGYSNALGMVKFMFPNKYYIYIHDTPSKSYFNYGDRALSSGCIRIQNPFELAEILLADQGYTQDSLQSLINKRDTKTIYLKEPRNVYILYWTAFIDPWGELNFRKDVYKRDEGLAELLREDADAYLAAKSE